MTERRRKRTIDPPPPLPDENEAGFGTFFLRFDRFARDIGGVVLLMLALLTLLGLFGVGGDLLDLWASLLQRWLGWGSLFVAATLGWGGWRMVARRGAINTGGGSAAQGEDLQAGAREAAPLVDIPRPLRWSRVLAFELAALASIGLLSVVQGTDISRAEIGLDGGLIGWGLAEMFNSILPPFLTAALLSLIVFAGCLGGLGKWAPFLRWVSDALERENPPASLPPEPHLPPPVAPAAPAPIQKKEEARRKSVQLPLEFQKSFRLEEEEAESQAAPPARDGNLPPLNLLAGDEHNARPSERHINQTAGIIEKTFSEFGIPARVVGFQIGPTVTQFAVEPGFVDRPGTEGDAGRQKVRVAQIASLQKDLALALSATRLRIEAPVPGRPYIGIEVPNSSATLVRLRSLLESERFGQINSPLGVALGRDVSGKPVVADLEKMPHLLIAGTTGSGKSVCIAALAVALVMNNAPDALRLIMIDPKMVELVRFNGLPHLYGKVETDVKRILGVLSWTVVEMERRYKLLEEAKARHIASYNRKVKARGKGEPLPRIVVFIDELADLMMSSSEQTEFTLVRLAQLARATGIHLIVATQRPSADIVTGLIKANFPARLSFTVASSIDSRVILDTPGAESLLGRGDMLFLPPDAPAPLRAQGVMVTDQEIERVIHFWKNALPQDAPQAMPWESLLIEESSSAGQDGLVKQAIAIVRQSGRANTSFLQRRLRIGYPRAARLMDELEDLGIVGPPDSAGRGEREVYLETDEQAEE